jgi:hypothetical protein
MHRTLAPMHDYGRRPPAAPATPDDQWFNQPAANLRRAPRAAIRIYACRKEKSESIKRPGAGRARRERHAVTRRIAPRHNSGNRHQRGTG